LASASNPGTKTSPARILVVEDEALVAMLIEDELFELGFDVVGPAATVSHALALCHDERIDGAVLDVNLGGGQRSDSVADFLLSKRIPFVFVTGYGDAGVSARFADKAVLQKPFALPDLRRLVERNFESFEASGKSARRAASG
jgi:DNA-binding NtrC family response regulator